MRFDNIAMIDHNNSHQKRNKYGVGNIVLFELLD